MKCTEMKKLKSVAKWSANSRVTTCAIATLASVSLASSVLAQITDVQQPTATTGPSLAQLGSTHAYIPMIHPPLISCPPPIDCGPMARRHALPLDISIDLEIQAEIEMKCPVGQTVIGLVYITEGQEPRYVVIANTNQQHYSRTLTLQPFSEEEVELAGQEALGGIWQGSHPNVPKTVSKILTKSIQVRGECSGRRSSHYSKTFPVSVNARFDDQDYPLLP